jgi:hypothetical protein
VSERTGGLRCSSRRSRAFCSSAARPAACRRPCRRFSSRWRRGSTGWGQRASRADRRGAWARFHLCVVTSRRRGRCPRLAIFARSARRRRYSHCRRCRTAGDLSLQARAAPGRGYDSLLRDPRHALHRRAVESLRNDQERAAAAPEIIAHHSPRPGSTISRSNGGARRGRPGAPKLRLHEAIAHLGKAIAIADKAAGERRYLQMPMATR